MSNLALKLEYETKIEFVLSYDYEKFTHFEGNREINRSNVESLKTSFLTIFHPPIILVNFENKILDGNHTMIALKELGLPFYFRRINAGIEFVHLINNVRKNWVTLSYLKGYCELNNSNYIEFNELRNKFQEFNFSILLQVACNSNNSNGHIHNEFKSGKFKFGISKFEAEERLLKIQSLSNYCNFYSNSRFCNALMTCLNHSEFDFTTFTNKVKTQINRLHICTDTRGYLEMIEEIYNYKSKNKIRLI